MVVSAAAKLLASSKLAAKLKQGVALSAVLATGAVVTTGTGGNASEPVKVVNTTPAPSATPAPAPTPAKPVLSTVPRFELGVNVGSGPYFSGEQVFANLLTGSDWEGPKVDALGNPQLRAGERTRRLMSVPAVAMAGRDTTIRCTWEGKGTVHVAGSKGRSIEGGPNYTEFVWNGNKGVSNWHVWLDVTGTDATPGDPLRNFDCREKGVARDAVFGAEFLDYMRHFSVLRFLDWSNVNGNPTDVTWARRTSAASIDQVTAPYGVAIEHMIGAANAVDADPWFNVPWNADEDYVRRMAQLVHDGVPAHRHVYVELSNEVWNYSFNVTRQAQAEGFKAGLAPDNFKAVLLRYAEKTRWLMRIWSEVFRDRPGQLVRVAATQGANPWTSEVVLGEGGLAPDVDALAIAPYFGNDLLGRNPGVSDVPTLMAALMKDKDLALAGSTQGSADVARKYGKRFIAYEAGQHVVDHGNVPLVTAINRSPLMYDIYKSYIAGWKSRYNDTMVLYSATGAPGSFGAWGLREYAGQPLADAHKMRAAIDMGR